MGLPYVDRMLIRLDNNPEHLRRLQALFINKLQSDIQKLRERVLNDLIKLFPLFSTLEPVHTANSHQALQACVYRVRVIGPQQLKCDIQEARPLLGEVMLENFLEERNELGADIRGCRRQSRNQAFSESWFLLLGDRCPLRVAFFESGPTPVDSVFQVHTSYNERIHELIHYLFPFNEEGKWAVVVRKNVGGVNQKKKEPTRKLNGVDLLRLQNVEQRIYKTRLRFGL